LGLGIDEANRQINSSDLYLARLADISQLLRIFGITEMADNIDLLNEVDTDISFANYWQDLPELNYPIDQVNEGLASDIQGYDSTGSVPVSNRCPDYAYSSFNCVSGSFYDYKYPNDITFLISPEQIAKAKIIIEVSLRNLGITRDIESSLGKNKEDGTEKGSLSYVHLQREFCTGLKLVMEHIGQKEIYSSIAHDHDISQY